MEDFLESVRIVLCDPKEARNVGGCIRAAANAGISKVSVIKEGGAYAYDLIDTYSAGAIDKISVEYFTSLQDAISDAHLVIGTSGLAPSNYLKIRAREERATSPAPRPTSEWSLTTSFSAPAEMTLHVEPGETDV